MLRRLASIRVFTDGKRKCVPGGYAKLYALNYLTGAPKFDLNGDDTVDAADASKVIGGGIPSKPVVIISPTGVAKLLISTSSTNPDALSEITGAGVTTTELEFPPINFFLRWWKEIFD